LERPRCGAVSAPPMSAHDRAGYGPHERHKFPRAGPPRCKP
jgi:hypothetical protein